MATSVQTITLSESIIQDQTEVLQRHTSLTTAFEKTWLTGSRLTTDEESSPGPAGNVCSLKENFKFLLNISLIYPGQVFPIAELKQVIKILGSLASITVCAISKYSLSTRELQEAEWWVLTSGGTNKTFKEEICLGTMLEIKSLDKNLRS